MTVTDRRTATAGRRRTADRRPTSIRWTASSSAPIDPIDLFCHAQTLGLEAALWLQPSIDRSIVGIGRAWAFDGGGPTRFADAAMAWRALLADAVRPSDDAMTGAGPILLGGLGFSGRTPADDDPWAPFGPASLVLPTFTLVQDGDAAGLTVAVGPDDAGRPDAEAPERTWTTIVAGAGRAGSVPRGPAAALHGVRSLPDRTTWERTVGLFAGAVGRGRLDKVVLARRVVFDAAADLDVASALRHLATTATESTTYAFSRAGATFVGATPERLVRTVGRRFETVAIAGSAPRGRDAAEDARLAAALLASEKEREEHAVVVDTIRAGLTPIVDDLQVADVPAVLPLRHLQHLATPITGTTRDEAGLLALGGLLHPTPAVGGAPRADALAMIDEHEGFDRGWYAGPIGWLDADGDGELMVALRGGIVSGRRATLFAGCGIVADSEPVREWEESGLKLRTMLDAFGHVADDDGR